MGKAQYSHFTIKWRLQMVGAGLQPDRIKDNIRILGFAFTPARGRQADENEKQKVERLSGEGLEVRLLAGWVEKAG